MDGNPRIVSGTVDIGAYEYQGTGSVISYAWLQQYGLPTDGSADFADPDHDGMNNWQEWICGTDPTNALSVLRLVSAAPAGTNATVTWQSVAGVTYVLQCSTNWRGRPLPIRRHQRRWPSRHHYLHPHECRRGEGVILSRGRAVGP